MSLLKYFKGILRRWEVIFKQQIEGVIFDIELEGYLKCQPGRDARRVRTFQAKKKKKAKQQQQQKTTVSRGGRTKYY